MRVARLHPAAIALLVALPCASRALADGVVAVRAGRVITMTGAPIDGATILIQDGRIKSIRREDAVPRGAIVIDAAESVVMPGLVDANARFGVRGDANEQSDEITPTFRISSAIDRDSIALKRAVQLGVTTLRVVPGNENVIAGTGVVIKPAGDALGDILLRDGGDLTIVMGNDAASGNRIPRSSRPTSFFYRQPTTRMGVVWHLRKALFDARTAMESGGEMAPAQRAIAAAMRGKVPIHIALRTAVDIETTLQIADEFDLRRLVFTECTEGYKLAGDIAERDIPVILGPLYYYPSGRRQGYEGWDVNWNNAGLLAKAGVKIAFASNDEPGPANLLMWATMAVRHGLPASDAMKALTVNPAEILGVADRVGSLARGRDADILILSGDPLQVTTRIEKVIINGDVVFDAESGANGDDNA